MASEKCIALFDRVFSPMSHTGFIADYWGKQFLRIQGTPARFASLLTWEELNAILVYQSIQPPELRLLHNGSEVGVTEYMEFRDGSLRIQPAAFHSWLGRGASLNVNHVDERSSSVRQLGEAFEDVLGAHTGVNVYVGWRTQKGFDLHWDPQDVTILQLSGRKHWKVYQPTCPNPLRRMASKPPKPEGDPVWEGILEDGDLLYIPRGWWHVAVPLNEPSLHLTVTCVPATGLDLMNWAVGRLKEVPDIRRNLPNLADKNSRREHGRLLREIIHNLFADDLLLDEFLAEWQSQIRIRPTAQLPFAPYEQSAALTMQTRVRLSTARAVVIAEDSAAGLTRFTAGTFSGECASTLVPALRQLRGTEACSIQALASRLEDSGDVPKLMILFTAMAMKGALCVESGESLTAPPQLS